MRKKHTEEEYLELEKKYGALTISYRLLGNQKMDLEDEVASLKLTADRRWEILKQSQETLKKLRGEVDIAHKCYEEVVAENRHLREQIFDEMQKRCNLDLDLEEFKNFKQIRDKLADTEKNLAIAQDDRNFLKKENTRLSVENTELKKQLADLQTNTAEAIGGIYSGHFSEQEKFAIYIMREIDKIFEPFISKDDNDTEN